MPLADRPSAPSLPLAAPSTGGRCRRSGAALPPVNIDVPGAVQTALSALPKLRALRTELARQFGEEMASAVDLLEPAADALGRAHADCLAFARPRDLSGQAAELASEHAGLLVDVRALSNRGLLPEGVLSSLRGGQSRKNLCFDVLQLTAALRAHWPEIEATTPLELADVDAMEARANRLAVALAALEQPTTAPETEARRRAFAELVRLWDRVRRMVVFLRWEEGDADRIAPSFWSGRRGRGRRRAETRRDET